MGWSLGGRFCCEGCIGDLETISLGKRRQRAELLIKRNICGEGNQLGLSKEEIGAGIVAGIEVVNRFGSGESNGKLTYVDAYSSCVLEDAVDSQLGRGVNPLERSIDAKACAVLDNGRLRYHTASNIVLTSVSCYPNPY